MSLSTYLGTSTDSPSLSAGEAFFMKEKILSHAPSAFARPFILRGLLPSAIDLPDIAEYSIIPTHCFALPTSGGAKLFPVHSLFLSLRSQKLAQIFEDHPSTGSGFDLPVIVLRIPSPKTFYALLACLYTGSRRDWSRMTSEDLSGLAMNFLALGITPPFGVLSDIDILLQQKHA
ncbi:hypothetical protein DL96DRAFT_1708910 [Flagelloscypha sp. PMI_526]|nr:hypothetical protein DL96DRAFT_1708910 [Flagelloscypha sp. PMI_526]